MATSLTDGLETESNGGSAGSGSGGGASSSKKKMILGGIAAAALFVAIVLLIRNSFGGVDVADLSRQRTLVDSESGEIFRSYKIKDGTSLPWKNPKTGAMTLYPAEKCHWTEDGKAKLEPTYVILNETIGQEGPTRCPDCGRIVVRHNPLPPTELLMEAEAAEKGS